MTTIMVRTKSIGERYPNLVAVVVLPGITEKWMNSTVEESVVGVIETSDITIDEMGDQDLSEFMKKWNDYATKNGFEFIYNRNLIKKSPIGYYDQAGFHHDGYCFDREGS